MTQTGISTAAWTHAAFGSEGFYTRNSTNPATHFRTSSHVGGPLVELVAQLVVAVDSRLGLPQRFQIVDVGAGGGELLTALTSQLRNSHPQLAHRVDATAIDLRPRPAALPPDIAWINAAAPVAIPSEIVGLVLALEVLDDVPTDLSRSSHPSRNTFAAEICQRVAFGSVLFVDYSAPAATSTLAAYSDGVQVNPTTNGSANLTAPVDFDQLEARLRRFGSTTRQLQADAFADLDAQVGPLAVLAAMQRASQIAELTDVCGLGAHEWLRIDIDSRGPQ